MTTAIVGAAEDDLETAFDYYEQQRVGLGVEFLDEYRRSVEKILQHPRAWQPLDETFRRVRLHRFPYGIVYRVDDALAQVVIMEVMHLAQKPGRWRRRER